MNKSIVYITQDNNKNYTQAHQFGEPRFVTKGEYSSISNSKQNTVIHDDIQDMVLNFNSAADYLLLSGDPIVISLCVHAILAEQGYIRVLKWSSQDRQYAPIVINT